MYVIMSVRNGSMTEVYEFMYSLRTLRHVPLLVRLSSRYDRRLRGETPPLTCERDRWRTVRCPTHILKSLTSSRPCFAISSDHFTLREAHDVHAYTY